MKEKCVNEEIFWHDIDINIFKYSKLIALFIITKLQAQDTNINVYIQHMDTKFKCEDM